jgi:hypothetical protein
MKRNWKSFPQKGRLAIQTKLIEIDYSNLKIPHTSKCRQKLGQNSYFSTKIYVDHNKMHNIFEAMYLYVNINTL